MKVMFQVENYSAVDILLPILAAFREWATGYFDEPKLAADHTIHSDLINYIMFKPYGLICSWISSYD